MSPLGNTVVREAALAAADGESLGRDEIPDLYDQFEQGEFGALRAWLGERLHRHGRKFSPTETLERVVGTPRIDPEPYVRYLRRKLNDVYGLPVGSG